MITVTSERGGLSVAIILTIIMDYRKLRLIKTIQKYN